MTKEQKEAESKIEPRETSGIQKHQAQKVPHKLLLRFYLARHTISEPACTLASGEPRETSGMSNDKNEVHLFLHSGDGCPIKAWALVLFVDCERNKAKSLGKPMAQML